MSASVVYQPSRGPVAKVRRRLVRRVVRNIVPLALERPVVSISFDDVPRSVMLNALPEMERRGMVATLYVATGLMGQRNHLGTMMDRDEVKRCHLAGHEIAAHSHSHRDLSKLGEGDLLRDIRMSERVFAQMGVPAPTAFAWPYGEASRMAKAELAGRYTSLRGIVPVAHRGSVDLNQVGSVPVFGSTLREAKRVVRSLKRRPGWVTLFTHDVREDPSPWGVTPKAFCALLDEIEHAGAIVRPVGAFVGELLNDQAV